MNKRHEFNVTLPADLTEKVEGWVNAGTYQSVTDAISDGVRMLAEREEAVEKWLQDEVVPAYDAFIESGEQPIDADDILPRIHARRARRG
jgi:Arc/MetJ-type ribon-helix-helix transcriptional regulator